MKRITTLIAAAALTCLSPVAAGEVSLESAPPVVVKTFPVAGTTNVDPTLTEIRVTYSKGMRDGSWSWSTWGEENFPETTGKPRYLADNRTCVLPVKLEPNRFYATWLNSDKFKNFKDTSGRPAVPYLFSFTTGESSPTSQPRSGAQSGSEPGSTPAELGAIPKAQDLPGKLAFRARYKHRSRGRDLDSTSDLWVKESPDGSLNILSEFQGTSEWASADEKKRITSYRIGRAPSADATGYRIELELTNGIARLTRRGIRQDCDAKELKVPKDAWFDPNTRPDSYCSANILLRAFALRDGETKEFRMHDWDNTGEALVDYAVRVKHAGRERVEVPAGTFEANHLVLTQVTSADTWFKKRAGHVTDFWVLDNNTIPPHFASSRALRDGASRS
jgi:hypothetical protein